MKNFIYTFILQIYKQVVTLTTCVYIKFKLFYNYLILWRIDILKFIRLTKIIN